MDLKIVNTKITPQEKGWYHIEIEQYNPNEPTAYTTTNEPTAYTTFDTYATLSPRMWGCTELFT